MNRARSPRARGHAHVVALALVLVLLPFGACAGEVSPSPLAFGFGTPRAPGAVKLVVPRDPILGTPRFDEARRRYVAPYGDGEAVLTLDARLHEALTDDLRTARPQWGSIVVVEVESGRILALADHSEREPGTPGVATRPLARAASVFKIITASALLRAGVRLDEVVCTSGGKTRMHRSNYMDDERRDARCAHFEEALPLSLNVVMAKLAGRHLTPALLQEEARLFGFDLPIAADFQVEPSIATIPEGDLYGFAETAAGFGDVRLSALHGALLAALVANRGVLVPARMIDEVHGEAMPKRTAPTRVLDEQHAAVLHAMMTATVRRGTATRAFSRTERGYRPFTATDVLGKTGSLTDRDVDLDYTWFVGAAPAHDPKIALAVAVVNDEWLWHARAIDLAKLALHRTFDLHPEWRDGDAALASSGGRGR